MAILDRVKPDPPTASGGVTRSLEFRRIQGLPRRVIDLSQVPDLSAAWRIDDHGCPGCELCQDAHKRPVVPTLRPAQSAALLEGETYGMLWAEMGVGHGKELTCLLLADAFDAKRAVILTKARLKSRMIDVDIPRYGRHFRLPLWRIGAIVSYHELSDPDTGDILERLDAAAPIDAVILNESHSIRNHKSARGKKYYDFVDARWSLKIAKLSGTQCNGSINDYRKGICRTLRHASPLPHSFQEGKDWARALDSPEDRGDAPPIAPGALLELCGSEASAAAFEALSESEKTVVAFEQRGAADIARKMARGIFRTRRVETPGVVATGNAEDCGATIVLAARKPAIPLTVEVALKALRKEWKIGEDELSDAKDVARYAKQLACGFYYRWVWPTGKDHEWLEARAAWKKRERHILQYYQGRGIYSPLMVWRAVKAGEVPGPELEAWEAVKDRYGAGPDVEPVWLHRFLIQDAVEWVGEADKSERSIIWYEHRTVADALESQGLLVVRAGPKGDEVLRDAEQGRAKGDHLCLSAATHRDGWNLQRYYRRNLVITPPASTEPWQQLLGRTHRPGQRADQVDADVYQHERALERALAQAFADARMVDETGQERQKLCQATLVGLAGVDPGEEVFGVG